MFRKSAVFVLIFFWLIKLTLAQSFFTDTVFVELKPFPDSLRVPFTVQSARDVRDLHPGHVHISEKKKLLFFPVDKYFIVKPDLSTILKSTFQSEDTSTTGDYFNITIHNFDIYGTGGWFKKKTNLEASIGVKYVQAGNAYAGTLMYEKSFPAVDKKDASLNFQDACIRWQRYFANDITTISNAGEKSLPLLLSHYFPGNKPPGKAMYISGETILGLDFYMFEGDVWFSNPETSKKYFRTGHTVRYRNAEKYESIAFGKNAAHRFFRMNDAWNFELKSSFLIGFNKWKDMDEANRKLEEILNFDYNLSQKLVYDPKNKQSLVFGVGVMENVNYIIHDKVRFHPGLILQVGVKLWK